MSISAVMPNYARIDLVFDRGQGAMLYTVDGRSFLDFGGGIAVNALGHAHPHLVAALKAQAEKLWHTSNLYRVAGQEKLAERLVANSFADTAFFCNSGAEAMECAVKMARRYHQAIQGEGGIIPADPEYLKGLRAMADEFGLLMIMDEVQTGMGRTGKLFAYEWAGITPDIMALAKGLGGGFPVGACLATERAAQFMTAGTHGSTFGGNPLAMACANAVMDVMLEKNFLPGVNTVAEKLWAKLTPVVAKHGKVFETIRGKGLMIGLKCKVPYNDVLTQMMHQGLLAVGAGDNTIRLLPPLIITEAEVDAGVAMIDRAAAAIAS